MGEKINTFPFCNDQENRLKSKILGVSDPVQQNYPFVYSSPHSGRSYPASFLNKTKLNKDQIRQSEDCFVDELIAPLLQNNVPILCALFPRAFIDVNREPYELDPSMFDEALPSYINNRSRRVKSGLGTIARRVCNKMDIYDTKLSIQDAFNRIEYYYKPYHLRLRKLIAQTYERFGEAILIDCHSMPSGLKTHKKNIKPDFILGDRYGTSCDNRLINSLKQKIKQAGYSVVVNRPYAGGFITAHYGRPERNLHTLQIEINRALYMNEKTLERHEHFYRLQHNLSTILNEVMLDYTSHAIDQPLAAE